MHIPVSDTFTFRATKKTADKRRKGNRAHHMTPSPSDNYEAQHVAHEQPGATYNLFALTGSRPDPIVTTVCVDGKLLSIRLIHEFSRVRQPLHCDVIVGKQ